MPVPLFMQCQIIMTFTDQYYLSSFDKITRGLPYVSRHTHSRPGLDTSNTRIILVKPQ